MGLIHLPLAQIEVWWPGLILLGIFIGILTGMFGAGGGFLLTPLLKIGYGIPYPIAVGSGLLMIFITGSFSAWKHWQNKNVDPLMGIIMAGGALAGTEVGVRLLKLFSAIREITLNSRPFPVLDLIMSGLFLALMSVVAVCIWRETSSAVADDEVASSFVKNLRRHGIAPRLAFPQSRIPSLSLWTPLSLSFVVGILTGLLGVGGGFINFPLLVYALGVPTAVAVGTSAFQIMFASGYGALRHALQNHVEIGLVVLLLVGSLSGVQLGVYVSRFFGGRKVRKYFAGVIGLGIMVVVWDLIRGMWF